MPLSFSSPLTATSPVVEQVLERKRRVFESKSSLKWAAINFFVAVICFVEAENHFFFVVPFKWKVFVTRVEFTLTFVFLINAAVELWFHFFPFGASKFFSSKSLSSPHAELSVSPQQKKLLGISDNDPIYTSKASGKEEQQEAAKAGHPFGFPAPLDGSFIESSTPKRGFSQQVDYHNLSSPSSFGGNTSSFLDTSSWLYYKPLQPVTPQPQEAPAKSPEPKRPTASSAGVINNEDDLREFISSLEAKQCQKNDLNTSGSTLANLSSSIYWQRGHDRSLLAPPSSPISAQDYSPVLQKLSYQLSSPMPTVASHGGGDESSVGVFQGAGLGSSSKKRIGHTSTELICLRLGINPINLASWMQNLRLWLSQSILSRMNMEIETINQKLSAHGVSDLIGTVGTERLRKCGQLFPELSTSIEKIIPFLEVTIHQDYLVHRISELSLRGAISEYRWNGGSTRFKGQDWSEKFPTDSEIIMNVFSAYMDSCMPANYTTPEGKPFSNVYFVKGSEKTDVKTSTTQKDDTTQVKSTSGVVTSCRIVQAPQKPPHYFLEIGGEKLDVSSGRNNLFHALLLFLHHIKTKENGILGRINFGTSGINILWVID